jgi:hypothetical protein
MELNDLPPEILIQIINCLFTRDIVRNVSNVSKRMNLLSSDSSVGITLQLTDKTDTSRISDILQSRSKQIHGLMLYLLEEEALDIVTNHIELLSEVKKIYILAMPSYKFPKRHMTQLTQLKKVTLLDIYGSFEDSCWNTIVEFKRLEDVTLRPFTGTMSQQDFKSLSSNLRNVSKVNLNFDQQTFRFLPVSIRYPDENFVNKRFSQIIKFRINSLTLSHFRMILSHFPNTSSLEIVGGKLEIENKAKISALHSLIKKCKNLSEIVFYSILFDEDAFKDIFSGWKVRFGALYGTTIKCRMKKI